METSVNNGMCRCCASEGTFKDVRSTYHWMGEEEIYADMLKECFDILLSKSEADNAGGICEVCITQLRNAANFKKQVLHTEEQFKKHFHNKIFKPIKLEVSRDGDELESDNNLSDDFSTDFDLPIKEEIEEPKPKKRTSAVKATTSKAKKAKVEGETSVKREPRESPVPKRRNRHENNKILLKDGTKYKLNILTVLQCSNATLIRALTELGYSCAFCEVICPTTAELKLHSRTHDCKQMKSVMSKWCFRPIKLDVTFLKCNLCEADIPNYKELVDHLILVHNKTVYKDIKDLIMPFKFDSDELKCVFCLETFNKLKLLMQHMHTHYRNYICEICNASFVGINSLTRHVKTHQEAKVKCEQCHKVFSSPENMKSHVFRTHDKKQYSTCRHCGEYFKDWIAKKHHLEEVHGAVVRKYCCNACPKKFERPSTLRFHIRSYHLGEKRFPCTECESSFFAKKELDKHMVKHTGDKKFQCGVCLKSYGRKSTLREHMRIHEDDRRFKCEHCGQAFVQKCSWKSHMWSKHGEEA